MATVTGSSWTPILNMDWTNQKLRDWVRNDLQAAKDTTWKFVCFHQPGFSIDKLHYRDQRMRLLCDIFQDCDVDLVFSGHTHSYQRSRPLLFYPAMKNGSPTINQDGTVSGEILLDEKFDGIDYSHPYGIIYIVSGAGKTLLSAPLNDRRNSHKLAATPLNTETFSDKYISSINSFTLCDVSNTTLMVSQVSGDGKILDCFYMEKRTRRH